MKFGFVYLWYDTKHKKFYLGSHLGLPSDGYIGSNHRFQCAYKSRPETFKRRILESHEKITSKELIQKEQKWLNLIKPEELSNRYYNEKNVAAGGNIVGLLSEDRKKEHARKSGLASNKFWNNISAEEYEKRKINAFGGNTFSREYLKERNKKLCAKNAKIIYPNGKEEFIKNIAEFCRKNNLNYGSVKGLLKGRTKTHKGFTGTYL
jgi:hypothetical protein